MYTVYIRYALMGILNFISSCNSSETYDSEVLTGLFAKSGICLNHIFTITGGHYNSDLVVPIWEYPKTNEVYKNAFYIHNICDLPENLAPGDTFAFKIERVNLSNGCMVCKAYSPVPPKGLIITFIN